MFLFTDLEIFRSYNIVFSLALFRHEIGLHYIYGQKLASGSPKHVIGDNSYCRLYTKRRLQPPPTSKFLWPHFE